MSTRSPYSPQPLAFTMHLSSVQEGKTPADLARDHGKAETLAVLEAAVAGRR